ncbi:MAG: hypothetical protein HY290_17595 [Planctomycetia bacterium]|nr:hypothetical protein [Planctomycetia bacterium]
MSPPAWLKELADSAALLMIPADVIAPIGCHYCYVDRVWEITLFASSTQIVGGGQDGEVRRSRFTLDVPGLMKLFADVKNVLWQAHEIGEDDELGPHIAVEGQYGDQDVCLRILAFPPKRFASGRRAIVYVPSWEETW